MKDNNIRLDRECYTVRETAFKLSLAEITIRTWVCKNKIDSIQLGRARRIPANEIERILKEGIKK